jgi:hypothetical protein
MKIQKRIFTALCCLLLTAQMVSAQKNMWLVTDTKQAYCVPLDSIKYGTFQADSCFRFDFTSFASNDSIRISAWIYPYGHFGRFGSPDGFYNVTPKYGICYSKTNSIPTLDDDVKTWTENRGTLYFTHLNPGTTIYYRTYVKLGDVVVYSAPQKVKTLGRMINGHKFLDLGLPSGLLWAETNLGAKTAGDVGDYYAWGETTPKDSLFTRAGYKYYTPPTATYSKYNGTDGLTELENTDDAAYVNWGSECRMPTKEDYIELLENYKPRKDSVKNSKGEYVKGYRVVKEYGTADIFFPGFWTIYEAYNSSRYEMFEGQLWTRNNSDQIEENSKTRTKPTVFDLYYTNAYRMAVWGYVNRYYGRPIRAVAEPEP